MKGNQAGKRDPRLTCQETGGKGGLKERREEVKWSEIIVVATGFAALDEGRLVV